VIGKGQGLAEVKSEMRQAEILNLNSLSGHTLATRATSNSLHTGHVLDFSDSIFVCMMVGRFSFFVRVLLAFYTSLAAAKAAQEPLVQQGYRVGEKIPVSCLNRTMYVAVVLAINRTILLTMHQ